MTRRSRAAAALLAAGLAIMAWLAPPVPSSPILRRGVVIAGISRYDPGTRVPDMPQCEMAARELAAQARTLPDVAVNDVHLLTRRVTREDVLGAIRKVTQDAGADGGVMVALSCAGSDDGLQTSNGVLTEADIRTALSEKSVRSVLLLLDAGSTGELSPEPDVPAWAVLSSCEAGQQPWPAFIPDAGRHDALRFMSSAPAGWARALEKTKLGRRGDLGAKNMLSAEDLALAAEGPVALAVRSGDRSGRWIDAETGARFLDLVSPEMVRRLNSGQAIPMKDLRDRWGPENFRIFADDLWSLSTYRFRRQSSEVRRRVIDDARESHGSQALRAVQRQLQRRGLLESPPSGLADEWMRLEARRRDRFVLVLPARQEGRLRGHRALAVYGRPQDCTYPMAYGTWSGELEELPRLRLELQIWGTWTTGTWDGLLEGGQAQGEWQGTYNALDRRIVGRITGKVTKQGSDTALAAMFEGTLASDGLSVSGTWKSSTSPLPRVAHWKLRK